MNGIRGCSALVMAATLMAGCAGTAGVGAPAPDRGSARTGAGAAVAPQAALATITTGRSTRAEVAAALGAAIVIRFDSGYEVWVYRWPGADTTPRAATELVVLFDAAGVAAKARLRPGYPSPG